MKPITSDTSNRIAGMTIVCTIIILCRHLPVAGVNFCMSMFGVDFSDVAVPAFFAVSGFLIGKKSDVENWYSTALQKRLKSLVLPYFAVNTLLIPVEVIYHGVLKLGDWKGAMGFNWYTISRIYGLTPEFHPASGPLWYVRCLVMFVVISPIIVVSVRKSARFALAFFVALLFAVSWLHTLPCVYEHADFFYSFFSLRGLVLFAGGIVYAHWCDREPSGLPRLALSLLLFGLGVVVIKYLPVAWLVGMVFLVGSLYLILPPFSWPRWLIASCFPIYAFHQIVYMGYKVVFASLGGVFGCWIVPMLLSFSVCCAISLLVRRYCPKVAIALFGGR